MGALVESLPTMVLGGAGLVMFGTVAATGIRILSNVDFKGNRHNMFIVAIAVGLGMIPMAAPNFGQWMPKSLDSLLHSGILLAAIAAVLLLGLVLADIQLADGSSGIDAVKDILKKFDVPVIFITAFPERLLTGDRPEPAFLISKPYSEEQVRSAVSQAMFFASTDGLGVA